MLNLFTLAFNCDQEICAQWEVIRRIQTPWRWVIVEGYAKPVKCSSWCKEIGERWHNNGRSMDRTVGTIERIATEAPGRVIPILSSGPWDGKVTMCNAALDQLPDPGVLIQIDADEFWRPEQFIGIKRMFEQFPDAGHAQFHCRFWITDRHVIFTENTYGSMPYEWFRAWRYDGKQRFEAHVPPKLEGSGKYIPRQITRALGLTFEHHAYFRRPQVEFKEDYYGYRGAAAAWDAMRESEHRVIRIADYLPWVREDALAVRSLW